MNHEDPSVFMIILVYVWWSQSIHEDPRVFMMIHDDLWVCMMIVQSTNEYRANRAFHWKVIKIPPFKFFSKKTNHFIDLFQKSIPIQLTPSWKLISLISAEISKSDIEKWRVVVFIDGGSKFLKLEHLINLVNLEFLINLVELD